MRSQIHKKNLKEAVGEEVKNPTRINIQIRIVFLSLSQACWGLLSFFCSAITTLLFIIYIVVEPTECECLPQLNLQVEAPPPSPTVTHKERGREFGLSSSTYPTNTRYNLLEPADRRVQSVMPWEIVGRFKNWTIFRVVVEYKVSTWVATIL